MMSLLKCATLSLCLAMAVGLTCKSGNKNHAVNQMEEISCDTQCLKTDYMIYSVTAGIPVSFPQTTTGCANPASLCTSDAQCSTIKQATKNTASGGMKIDVRECKSVCCSTDNCNVPNSTYVASVGSAGAGPPPLPDSTTDLGGSVSGMVTPSVPKFVCRSGPKNFAVESISEVSCSTECVTNDLQVHMTSNGKAMYFHQSTYMCAPMKDFCKNFDVCDQMKSQLKNLDLGMAVEDLSVKNCKTKCCTVTNCNQPDPLIDYKLYRGASTRISISTALITLAAALSVYFVSKMQ